MKVMCSSAMINIFSYSKKSGSQGDIVKELYNYPHNEIFYEDISGKTINRYRHGNPLVDSLESKIASLSVHELAKMYKDYLEKAIDIKYKRNIILAIRDILSTDPISNDTYISEELQIKKGDLLKGSHVCFHYVIAVIMIYCSKNLNQDTFDDITKEYLDSFNDSNQEIYFDNEPVIKSSSISLLNSQVFTDTFVKVQHSYSIEVNNPSKLEIYHLKIANKNYDYKQASRFLNESILSFLNSRIYVSEKKENNEYTQLITKSVLKFIKTNSNESFSNIMLYSFLECALKAPKILSSYEIKTAPGEFKSASSGIHLLPKANIGSQNNQLVFGASKIDNDFISAIDIAFEQILKIEQNRNNEINFIDENIFRYCFSKEDSEYLKSLILPNYSGQKPDMSFGLFISFNYSLPNKEILSVDQYQIELTNALQNEINLKRNYIQNKINSLGLSDYSFYIYLLPLENTSTDKDNIYKELEEF